MQSYDIHISPILLWWSFYLGGTNQVARPGENFPGIPKTLALLKKHCLRKILQKFYNKTLWLLYENMDSLEGLWRYLYIVSF